ncbi:hypothetical protein ZTR_05707 [Talaromyces verruculosus]|nr:hypothetical protein ZTR_05707 [Talaromyces verruculosus]
MTSVPLPGRIEQVYAAPYLRWDLKFTRRNPKLYELEDKKPFKPDDTKDARLRINQFFDQQTHRLLPKSYSYQTLRDFLALANTSIFEQGSLTCLNMPDLVKTVLFDERTDDQSLNMFTSRQWQGYEQYPPKGIAEYTAVLTPKECYEKLSQPRNALGKSDPERRSIYIQDLSPSCAAGLILAISHRYAVFFRDFLSRYVTSRVYFGVLMDHPVQPATPYALEFHIPYFALRKSFSNSQKLHSSIVGRRSGVFADTFTRNCEPGQKEYFHEAQVSVLLVGIDEWVWTLYCLVETHFEEKQDRGDLEDPIWNPREYFLLVLCRRMDQATLEWQNLVETLDQRLKVLDDETFVKPSKESLAGHNSDTSRINDYSWAIQVLQLFTNTLVKTIESWQEFSRIHLPTFLPGEGEANYSSQVPSYLQRLDRDVSELRYFHTLLGQRIVAFESRRTMNIKYSSGRRQIVDQSDHGLSALGLYNCEIDMPH